MPKLRKEGPGPVTMKDVALRRRRLAIDRVVRAQRDRGDADQRRDAQTRRRGGDELGYRPRAAGRPAKSSRSRVIGVIVDEIATSPFASISLDAVQEEAWKSGILTECVVTRGDQDYETAILRKWASERVDGVIYCSILTRRASLPEALSRHRAVLLNCYSDSGAFASVVPAERRGGEAATEALIAEGHRRIAFITGETWMEAAAQRMEGYERALDNAGIAVDPALVVEGNFLPSGGHAATRQLMAGPTRPDAIFCANDLTALGCYEALKERGERIGETIAVMGYDDQEIAQHLSPQLSTVLLPHREMGSWSVRHLLSATDGDRSQVRLECPLVLRQSHTLPRGAGLLAPGAGRIG